MGGLQLVWSETNRIGDTKYNIKHNIQCSVFEASSLPYVGNPSLRYLLVAFWQWIDSEQIPIELKLELLFPFPLSYLIKQNFELIFFNYV